MMSPTADDCRGPCVERLSHTRRACLGWARSPTRNSSSRVRAASVGVEALLNTGAQMALESQPSGGSRIEIAVLHDGWDSST